jgi:predicted flap endonuclease-1-like 5' DNA nuclease
MLAQLSFNLPMFYAILLLFAGVLLGYALWLPFRIDTESITRRLNDLRDQEEEQTRMALELSDAREKTEKAHIIRKSLEMDLADRREQCEALAEALDQSRTEHVSITHELKRTRDELTSVQDTGEPQQVQESTAEANRRAAELKALAEDYRNLQSKYELLVQDLDASREINTSREKELNHANDALEASREELVSLRRELDETRVQLQAAACQRDDALGRHEMAAGAVHALRIDLGHHQRAMETIQRHRSRTQSSLSNNTRRQNELEEVVRHHEHTIDTLREELTESTMLRRQCISLQTTLQDQTAELHAIRLDRDEVAAELAAGKNRWKNIDQRLEAYQHDLDRVRQQREELLVKLNDEKSRNEELSGALEKNSNRLERDGDELTQIDSLEGQTTRLEAQTDQQQVQIAELAIRRDERRGLVFTSAPAEVDDLQLIGRIAQILEQRLNEFGVYTYKQIMEWDAAAVDEFSNLLAFRDRIEREDWVGQATTLYLEKYGRAA